MVTEGKSVINSSSCNTENISKMMNISLENPSSFEKVGKTGEEITNANPIDTNVNDKPPNLHLTGFCG